jgi:hypothetical protein
MLKVFVSKCLRQLIDIGCIVYEPSPNPALKSKVYLVLKDHLENDSFGPGAQPCRGWVED